MADNAIIVLDRAGNEVFRLDETGSKIIMNQKQIASLVIENRTSDPTSPVEGQIWIRTDV